MIKRKYVLVTGASSGLGNAIVHEILTSEYTVFAGVRNEKDKDLFANKQNIIPVILDISKPGSISSAFQIIKDTVNQNGLYALINNAGINYLTAFELGDEQKERQLFEVNLFGAMSLTRKLLPLLHQFVAINKSSAKIVNVSSIGGVFGLPWEASYHSSKFAMIGFSQSLRYELEALNISVCCFLPGGMKTNIFKKSVNELQNHAVTVSSPHLEYYLRNQRHMGEVMQRFENGTATPQNAAKVISKLLLKEKMPVRKYFGTDAKFIKALTWLGLEGILKNRFVKR